MGHAVKGDTVCTSLIAVVWGMARRGVCMHRPDNIDMGYDVPQN